MKYLFTFITFLVALSVHAQLIEGIVKNKEGELLPFASIQVKGTNKGFTANNQAEFKYNLAPGTYTLICEHVGYKKQEMTITVGKVNQSIEFSLTPVQLHLKEVIIRSGDEDPAYEIIRQAIKKKTLL